MPQPIYTTTEKIHNDSLAYSIHILFQRQHILRANNIFLPVVTNVTVTVVTTVTVTVVTAVTVTVLTTVTITLLTTVPIMIPLNLHNTKQLDIVEIPNVNATLIQAFIDHLPMCICRLLACVPDTLSYKCYKFHSSQPWPRVDYLDRSNLI